MNLISDLVQRFSLAEDISNAHGQQAYMRNLFVFHGIKKPTRAALQKEVFSSHSITTEKELISSLSLLWELPQREYQYTTLDLAYKYRKLWTSDMFSTFESFIRTKSWWDTVDTLASKLVGSLVQNNPGLSKTMDAWILDNNMWIRRSAIIYQLSYKDKTNAEQLFRYCRTCMHEKEFFIQKAIGWALRSYARTAPKQVIAFLTAEKDSLAPLSYREASKHLKF